MRKGTTNKQIKKRVEIANSKLEAQGLKILSEKPILKKLPEQYKGLYTEEIIPFVEELASKGCTDKEIYNSIGISNFTFYEWRKKHPAFSHSLNKYRGLADVQVENALYKSALGFDFTEVKKQRIKTADGSYELIVTEENKKHVAASAAAQIFYLKNRMPERYRDKVEVAHGLSDDISQLAFAIKRRGE